MMLRILPKQLRLHSWTGTNSKFVASLKKLQKRRLCTKQQSATVKIKFVDLKNNVEKTVEATVGDHILDVAHKNEIDLEGACEASLACSTCHVILEDHIYKSLDDPCDEEDDLLDLAYGLTMTSRLGCQVKVTKEMDGTTVKIPSASRNFYVDGHVPKPH